MELWKRFRFNYAYQNAYPWKRTCPREGKNDNFNGFRNFSKPPNSHQKTTNVVVLNKTPTEEDFIVRTGIFKVNCTKNSFTRWDIKEAICVPFIIDRYMHTRRETGRSGMSRTYLRHTCINITNCRNFSDVNDGVLCWRSLSWIPSKPTLLFFFK